MARPKHAFPQIRLSLLGPLLLERDGQVVTIRRRKAQLLLAYLTVNRRPQARERIATLFWGESTDEQARLSLRVTLNALRKALHPEVVLADRETIQLHPETPLWADTTEFARVARFIQQLPVNSDANRLADALSALNAHYRGEFLLGNSDDWILQERERFRNQYLEQLLHLTGLFRAAGDYTRAVSTARQVLTLDPANEQAHQHLMICLAMLGDRTAAMEQYEIAVRALQTELGVEPSPETIDLAERIARHSPGESPAAALTNLPGPLTRFFGRETELSELQALMRGSATGAGHTEPVRVVTLTGVGGTGKTRLAIQLGRTLLEHYPDGVWWLELAPLSESALVGQELAKTIGAPEEPNETTIERLRRFLSKRKALIILDNCEHLIDECARLIESLAAGCPQVQFLTTSREPLGIPGERLYPVRQLDIPELGVGSGQPVALLDYAAVQLLIERATSNANSFQLTDQNSSAIAHICRQLDGIPLALEIAAAQLRVMSADELAARLDERLRWVSDAGPAAPRRQQTVRALFDWSFEALALPERTLFCRLAVFRGGFDPDAAAAVAYGDIDTTAQVDELGTTPQLIVEHLADNLVEKSLLLLRHTPNGARYELLETLREYAEDKLTSAGEAAQIRARHLAHYDALVGKASESYYTPDQVRWLDQLEREHSNLRAALAYAEASGALETQLHMCANLAAYWQMRNYWTEAREWLRQALAHASEAAPSLMLAKTYGAAGVMAWLQGDYTRALERHEKGLELYRQLQDTGGIANALNNVALQYQGLGRHDEARGLYDKALQLAREAQHPRLILRMLNNLASITYLQADFDASDKYSQEALARARELGEKYALAVALANRAQILLAQNHLDEALAHTDEVYQAAQELGNREFMAEGMRHKAMVLYKRGEYAAARPLFHESLKLAFELGAKRQMIWSMEGLALALASEREWVTAAHLFAAATTLREQTAIPKDAVETADHAALQSKLGLALGPDRLADEWEDGISRGPNAVIAEALASEAR